MYTRNNGRTRIILSVLSVLASILIVLAYFGGRANFISRLQHMTLVVTAPLQKAVNAVTGSIGQLSQYTLIIGDLTKENRILKRDNIKLRQKINQLEHYSDENRRLLRLAGFRKKYQPETVGAHVISRSPLSWQSIVTIDIGSSAGVGENMAVITDKGLVGRTARAVGSATLVQLLDDRRSGVSVELARTGAIGIVEGLMDGRLRLRFMSADADVRVGDRLLTSGVGGVYPRGIAVGKVSEIAKTTYSLEKKISVRPAVDYARLSEVLVINEKRPARGKL